MSELKNCPFCGSDKVSCEDMGEIQALNYYVVCADCGSRGAYDLGQSGAIEIWNTRPIEDALRSENERLRGAIAVGLDYYGCCNCCGWHHTKGHYKDCEVLKVLTAKDGEK